MMHQGNQVPATAQLLYCIMFTPQLQDGEETEEGGVGGLIFKEIIVIKDGALKSKHSPIFQLELLKTAPTQKKCTHTRGW